MAGQNKHWNGLHDFARLSAEPVEEVETRKLWHLQIENDCIDLFFQEDGARVDGRPLPAPSNRPPQETGAKSPECLARRQRLARKLRGSCFADRPDE